MKECIGKTNRILKNEDDNGKSNLSTYALAIAFPILGFIVLLFLLYCLCKLKQTNKRRKNEISPTTTIDNTDFPSRASSMRSIKLTMTSEQFSQYFMEFVYTENLGNLDKCMICLDNFIHNETIVIQNLVCEHYFHEHCMKQWLKKAESCPYCNIKVGLWDLAKIASPVTKAYHYEIKN